MLQAYGLILAAVASLGHAQSAFQPLRPPAQPLAVKSPYFSTYQQAGKDSGNGGYLAGEWPVFWNGPITGWCGYIRVDNVTYIWMGAPNVPNTPNYFVSQQKYTYTATKSIYNMDVAGQVGMEITFTSPVLPDTLLEMSLPYTYLDVAVRSIDGKAHEVQVYTDISAEWVAGDRGATAQWSYGISTGAATPNAVAPLKPAVSPNVHASPTVYATNTHFKVVPVTHTEEPAIATASRGAFHPGETSVPKNAPKHAHHRKTPKVNPNTGGIAYHEVYRQQQLEFAEYNQQAEWGYWYYATANVANLTHQSARDIVARAQFIDYGYLNNTQDTDYRAIDNNYPVFGFAVDLGSVSRAYKNTTFQISLHQDNCVQFESASGNVSVPCMWTNYFDNAPLALNYFYTQHSEITQACSKFDAQLESDSKAVAPGVEEEYYAITALATRQTFGTLEYTNSPATPWVFMKEISSGGDAQTVDVIYPLHPIMIYANSTILKWMLEPLLINQEAGYFPFVYSMHDLGAFPNNTGHNNVGAATQAEEQPLEESGNMVIMALAYAQRANDNAWLAQHYSILKQWTDYLVNTTLYPGTQLSTDDFIGPLVNDTNLAIKGMIGIGAMAQIANRTGHIEDGLRYGHIARRYIHKWYDLGFNYNSTPPHEISGYNEAGSTWSTLYNLFGDKECGLELVKNEIYQIQSNFYPTIFGRYGVPLRNTVNSAKVDWEMWVASIAEQNTKNQFIGDIAEWLRETPTGLAFTDDYDVTSGDYGQVFFINRPVVGGMFAPLALRDAPTSPTYLPK